MVDDVRATGSPRARPGRWRTGEESRRRILAAARTSFARLGYDRATVRHIAANARVDPSMVYYFFATKSRLFAAAMALPVDPAERVAALLDGGVDDLGPRIVEHFLSVWDDTGGFEPMFGLMRSPPADERSAGTLREFVQREIVGQLRRVIGGEDAQLRAELAGAHLMGLALARYIVAIEPLASAAPETVAAWVGPVLQHYFTGPTPGSG